MSDDAIGESVLDAIAHTHVCPDGVTGCNTVACSDCGGITVAHTNPVAHSRVYADSRAHPHIDPHADDDPNVDTEY
jgi:hypothetical protein